MADINEVNLPERIKDLNLDDQVKLDLSGILESSNNMTKSMVGHINTAADMCKFSGMFNQVEDGFREIAEGVSEKISKALEGLTKNFNELATKIEAYLNALKESDLAKLAEKVAVLAALIKIAQENPELIIAELLKSELQVIDQMKQNLLDITTAINSNSCVVLGRRALAVADQFDQVKNSVTSGSLSDALKSNLGPGKSALDTLRDGMKNADSIKAMKDFSADLDSKIASISIPSFETFRIQAGLPEISLPTIADTLSVAPVVSPSAGDLIPANLARTGVLASLVGSPDYDTVDSAYINSTDTVYGTSNNDVIKGVATNSSIHGESGDDIISGVGSTIYGGRGNDTISGSNITVSEFSREDKRNAGNDTIIFDKGNGNFRIELDRSGQLNVIIRGYKGTEMAIKSYGNSASISKGSDRIDLIGFSEMRKYGGTLRVRWDDGSNRILTERDLINIDEKGT